LRTVGIGLGALMLGGRHLSPSVAQAAGNRTAWPSPVPAVVSNFDLEVALEAVETQVQVLPGNPTRVWSYRGRVLKGDPASLQALPGSYLGPVIRAQTGQTLRVTFTNRLTQESIIHWHGLIVPAEMDGHPRTAVASGRSYTYEFPIVNRAGTYWFHPHPHGHTGQQVYQGLAGLLLVSDAEEEAAGLPTGGFDIPVVIQDRTFDANNQLVYLPNGMMDRLMGFLGERILVNGQPDYTLAVASQAYRLRLLNGSNGRIYKLGWDDGTPLVVIGTDGGLLRQAVQRDYVMLSPGERVDLWADFSGRPVGSELILKNLAFAGFESTHMMGSRPVLPEGSDYDILRVRVERQGSGPSQLPARLSSFDDLRLEEAVNSHTPRTFTIAMQHMAWTINGRQFEINGVAPDEVVKAGTLEVWEFVNQPGRMGMMGDMDHGGDTGGGGEGAADHTGNADGAGHGGGAGTSDHGQGAVGSAGHGGGMAAMMEEMAHPMHIHGVQFQVLDRQVRPDMRAGWETVSAGLVDEGWKDTVLMMPGERVKLLVKFAEHTGLYLYHCHNLEHEDGGLMRNYEVAV
jgi:FtsP/CotA-like multicopper oxidase with cupredoxin domain